MKDAVENDMRLMELEKGMASNSVTLRRQIHGSVNIVNGHDMNAVNMVESVSDGSTGAVTFNHRLEIGEGNSLG